MHNSLVLPSNKVEQIYTAWIAEALWSLRDAIQLFGGYDPRNGICIDGNLVSNTLKPNFNGDFLYFSSVTNNWNSLEDLALKHIAAGLLEKQDFGPGPYFKPGVIISWMLLHTEHKPSSVLLKLLGLEKSLADVSHTSENIQKIVLSSNLKKGKTLAASVDEMHVNAVPLMRGFYLEHGRIPLRVEIATMLQATHKYHWSIKSIERYLVQEKLETLFRNSKEAI